MKGETRAVARALTRIESGPDTGSTALLKALFPHTGRARVVGITGSPGTGKSTLVEQIARHYRREHQRVGIIAVDPTSPFSGGAILGDRIRMQQLSTDPDVFIRSMATRGRLGGLSAAVAEGLLILDAAGFDPILIETVGVGQDEVEIVVTAEIVVLVLVPGMGDDVQTIKAGTLEIADVFVINKADVDGTEETEADLQALLSLATRADGWVPPIVKTVATHGRGVSELVDAIDAYFRFLTQDGRRQARNRNLIRSRLVELIRDRLLVQAMKRIPEEKLEAYTDKLLKRETDPYTAAEDLLSSAVGGQEEK